MMPAIQERKAMQQQKFMGTYLEFQQYLQRLNIPSTKKVIFFVDQPLTDEQEEKKRILQQTLQETKASYLRGEGVVMTKLDLMNRREQLKQNYISL